jgi:hypothetical protein
MREERLRTANFIVCCRPAPPRRLVKQTTLSPRRLMIAAPGELRWRHRRSSFRVPGEVFRPGSYEVADLPEADAKSFVETHHYSGRYVAARFRFGLYRRGVLAGVAVFSHPCNDRPWNAEHDFRVSKSEIGFRHFEGRSYVALMRHLTLCLVTLTFVAGQAERLRGEKSGGDDGAGVRGVEPAVRGLAGSAAGDESADVQVGAHLLSAAA